MGRVALYAGIAAALGVAAGVAFWLGSQSVSEAPRPAADAARPVHPLMAFDNLEIPASALLQPRTGPDASAYDALRPVEARPGRPELLPPQAIARETTRTAGARPSRELKPPIEFAIDPSLADRARDFASAVPELRALTLAADAGRPGGDASDPRRTRKPGAEPALAPSTGAPPSGQRPALSPTGYGLWSQSPPPAGNQGDGS